MFKTTVRRTLLLISAFGVLAGVTAGTASASPRTNAEPSAAWGGCPSGRICLYDGTNGNGYVWVAPSCGFYWLSQITSPPPGHSWAYRVKSMWAHGGNDVQLWYVDSNNNAYPEGYANNGQRGNVPANAANAVSICATH